ncbi:MAG: ferritin [Armatimonadetes bacterium]|nr:ferritin [Armatimonadota bacterium]
MRISNELNAAFNEQIGRELESSHLYMSIAAFVDGLALKKFAELLFKQSLEERDHAMLFLNYLLEVDGNVAIPSVAAPRSDYKTVEEAMRHALDSELDLTRRIEELMTQARQQNDYSAQQFLTGMIAEQREEVSTAENMLKVVRQAGERSLMMIEAYLVHLDL